VRKLKPALLMIACAATSAFAQDPSPSIDKRPALLQALDGHWVMTGDVLGKPVTYDMVAVPTLHDAFTELHMTDAQVPSEYEARVFIGVDPDSHLVIAHWLDNFGAKYSIPHGTGEAAQPDGSWKHFARHEMRLKQE